MDTNSNHISEPIHARSPRSSLSELADSAMNRLQRAVSHAGIPVALASSVLLNIAFFTDGGQRLFQSHQESQAASTEQPADQVSLFGGADASLKTTNMDLLDVAIIEADQDQASKWMTIKAAIEHMSPAEQERTLEELAGVDQEWAHIKTIQKGIEAQEDALRSTPVEKSWMTDAERSQIAAMRQSHAKVSAEFAELDRVEKMAGPGGLKPRVDIILKPDYSLELKEESPQDFATRMKVAFSETSSNTERMR